MCAPWKDTAGADGSPPPQAAPGHRWGPGRWPPHGPRPCPWGRGPHPHRGSLRRRLAWAFILVALLTLAGAFGAMGSALWGRHAPRPWNFHLLFLAIAVAAAASLFFSRRITRGLSRLRAAVERLDLRDLTPRVPVEGDDEVAALARAFNRMADRLEAEERVRRQLFADVAHELRHPLAVLRGRLEAMQDGAVPTDAEQVLRLHDMVIALGRLVGDLRDLSLADVGQLSLNLAPLDLAALLADLRDNMQPVAADKRITLAVAHPPDLPPVRADADRIRQVLVNLLANALHHTPEGGRVDIRADADHPQGTVRVEVADTGPGIPAADLPHIFDRFYRTDPARARATGGSGLGLAIVRSLIALHGGTVTAHASPGQGSRFVVTLPVGGPETIR